MNGVRRSARLWLCALWLAAGAGCLEGGENDRGPLPGQADLRGIWTGVYYQEQAPGATRRELTARVRQDGDGIMIRTSLSGVGERFTGRMEPDGNLYLIDAHDGEDWTTHLEFRPSAGRLRISDFLRPPDPEGDPDPPKQVIDLRRP